MNKTPLALVVNRDGEIWSQKGIIAHADSKSELELKKRLVETEISNFKAKKLFRRISRNYYFDNSIANNH